MDGEKKKKVRGRSGTSRYTLRTCQVEGKAFPGQEEEQEAKAQEAEESEEGGGQTQSG